MIRRSDSLVCSFQLCCPPALGRGIGLRSLARVVQAYPTQAEAIKMAADAYNGTLTPILKRLLVLVGQRKALAIAVRNDRPQRRYSGLLASLRGDHSVGSID